MWPSGELLLKLRGCYEAQRAQMPERVCNHADEALQVLTRRMARARERARVYGCTRATRLPWLRHVWRGNLRAATGGSTGFRGPNAKAAAPPPGRVSRRGALQLGVMRVTKPGAAAAKGRARAKPTGDQ
jgi:hypothetical protein